jgi:hypothetical protein
MTTTKILLAMNLHDDARNPNQTFDLFERLPIELRGVIWRASLVPRVIRLVEILAGERGYQRNGPFIGDEGFNGNGYINDEPDEDCIEAKKRLTVQRTREDAVRAVLESDEGVDNVFVPAGVDQESESFRQLRLEQRYWSLIELIGRQNRQHRNVLCTRYHTVIHTVLPAALFVCRESREAVLPLYPLCFASATHPPSTRFNLSLDILLITQMDSNEVADLFGALRPMETSRLSNLAFEDIGAYPGKELWIERVNRLTGLKNILAFRSVRSPLKYINRHLEKRHLISRVRIQSSFDRILNHAEAVSREVFNMEADQRYNRIDLHDDFPNGILDGVNLQKLSTDLPKLRLDENLDWIPKKAKMVWVWQRRIEAGCSCPGFYQLTY